MPSDPIKEMLMKAVKPKVKVRSKAALAAKEQRDAAKKLSRAKAPGLRRIEKDLFKEILSGERNAKLKPKKYKEAAIEAAVCAYGNDLGLVHYKFTSPSRRAVPDQMFIRKDGKVFFIEFKATGKSATVPQEREHTKLRQQGCHVFVVNDIAFGKGVLIGMIEGFGS